MEWNEDIGFFKSLFKTKTKWRLFPQKFGSGMWPFRFQYRAAANIACCRSEVIRTFWSRTLPALTVKQKLAHLLESKINKLISGIKVNFRQRCYIVTVINILLAIFYPVGCAAASGFCFLFNYFLLCRIFNGGGKTQAMWRICLNLAWVGVRACMYCTIPQKQRPACGIISGRFLCCSLQNRLQLQSLISCSSPYSISQIPLVKYIHAPSVAIR